MLKGLFLHSAAKVIFVLCTYIIHLYLGKTLSSSEYGVIGVVLSVITLNYNFLSNGARQSVAKNLALKVYDERDLVNKSIITQGIISIILMLLNWALAGTMAQYLNASSMAYYIKVSALMIPFTGFYFIFVGIVNGLKLFVTEAAIVSIYPILRVTVIPYVKFVFSDSALGTVAGFFTAAFICCIIGAFIFIVII
jgi:O-antigen/teichoic acid export membrane protein